MRKSKLNALLIHPGILDLLGLRRADGLAGGRSTEHVDYCELLLKEWTEDELNPPQLLTGDDLKQHGLEPGPKFKPLLDTVREAQFEVAIKTRQHALLQVQLL